MRWWTMRQGMHRTRPRGIRETTIRVTASDTDYHFNLGSTSHLLHSRSDARGPRTMRRLPRRQRGADDGLLATTVAIGHREDSMVGGRRLYGNASVLFCLLATTNRRRQRIELVTRLSLPPSLWSLYLCCSTKATTHSYANKSNNGQCARRR